MLCLTMMMREDFERERAQTNKHERNRWEKDKVEELVENQLNWV